jgi:Ca2+/Na+ antiporter
MQNSLFMHKFICTVLYFLLVRACQNLIGTERILTIALYYVFHIFEYSDNNNNNNTLFSIRYGNTLSFTIYKVLLYNKSLKKIGNCQLLYFIYITIH